MNHRPANQHLHLADRQARRSQRDADDAQVLAEQDASTGDIAYYLADHLGSVRDVIDNTGDVVNHIRYDAFGNVVDESDPAYATRYKYTGREFDPDTGLQYNRARWYDPKVGRWISEDPIEFEAGDANLYRYVGNSTTAFVDPSGLDFIAIGDMPVLHFGGHYSLVYYSTRCDVTPENQWYSKTGGGPSANALSSLGAKFEDAVELWREGGYSAWAEARYYQGLLDRNTYLEQRVISGIGVSTIIYGYDMSHEVHPLFFNSDDAVVKAKWNEIIANAKNYRFAEQESDERAGRFPNWPNSFYLWNGSNSNTFVREMVRKAGLTMVENTSRWHPGSQFPHRNRQPSWDILNVDKYWWFYSSSPPFKSSGPRPPAPPLGSS